MCADSCILLYSPLTLSRTLDPCLLCGSNFLLSCYITCCLLLLLLGMASCYWNFSFLTCTAIQMVTPSSSTQPEKFESLWTCLEDNEEDLIELCITSVYIATCLVPLKDLPVVYIAKCILYIFQLLVICLKCWLTKLRHWINFWSSYLFLVMIQLSRSLFVTWYQSSRFRSIHHSSLRWPISAASGVASLILYFFGGFLFIPL